jgi:hypothetical protein
MDDGPPRRRSALQPAAGGHAPTGRPTSHSCPNGSSNRPIRHPCSSETGLVWVAPATTAASRSDAGSSTTSNTRPVAPPIAFGLKRRSCSEAVETQNRAPATASCATTSTSQVHSNDARRRRPAHARRTRRRPAHQPPKAPAGSRLASCSLRQYPVRVLTGRKPRGSGPTPRPHSNQASVRTPSPHTIGMAEPRAQRSPWCTLPHPPADAGVDAPVGDDCCGSSKRRACGRVAVGRQAGMAAMRLNVIVTGAA